MSAVNGGGRADAEVRITDSNRSEAPQTGAADAVHSLLSRVIESGGNAAFNILLARLLAPEGFGRFAVGYSLAIFAISWADFGRSQALLQRASRLTEAATLEVLQRELHVYVALAVASAGLLVPGLLLLTGAFDLGLPDAARLMAVLALAEVLRVVSLNFEVGLKALGRWAEIPPLALLNYPLATVLSVIAVVSGYGVFGAAWGLLGGRVVLLSVTGWRMRRLSALRFGRLDGQTCQSLIQSGAGFGIYRIVLFSGVNAALPLLVYTIGSAEAGGYAHAANKLLMALVLLQTPILEIVLQRSSIVFHSGRVHGADELAQRLGETLRRMMVFTALLLVPFIFLSRHAVHLVLGAAYDPMVPLLLLAVPSLLFRSFYTTVHQELLARELRRPVAIWGGVWSLVFAGAVAGGTYLWPTDGTGAGAGMTAAGAVGVVLAVVLARRYRVPVSGQMSAVLSGLIVVLTVPILLTMHLPNFSLAAAGGLAVLGTTVLLFGLLKSRLIRRGEVASVMGALRGVGFRGR